MTEKAETTDLVDAFLSNTYLNTEELRTEDEFTPDEFLVSKRFLGLDGLITELSRVFENANKELMNLVKENYQDFVRLGTRMNTGNQKVDVLLSAIQRSEEQIKKSQNSVQDYSQKLKELMENRQRVENEKQIASDLLLLHRNLEFLKKFSRDHPLWLDTLNIVQALSEMYKNHPWVKSLQPEIRNLPKNS
ncbi:transport complex subunit Cog2 [Schizosaccharomyces cryophilus OY26]|uniref:Conserved oligomeric Golgi complex subunit 2 n=1 Tax=Schizosaccharomyces cryophilus (strain OY26 / ATCC MYA-4695 / CBS 11777 / NBRC 106824 / NRRL Y48691) TaxID=653667 RepID=S9XKM6_SCHCR|nr:transport complex subunit Cog2 [Schizosaccharomyces cryophilus OY26]EPY54266.1 transport complex subunit Cog2 [Schizosaccharomyces cryophilus OY26]